MIFTKVLSSFFLGLPDPATAMKSAPIGILSISDSRSMWSRVSERSLDLIKLMYDSDTPSIRAIFAWVYPDLRRYSITLEDNVVDIVRRSVMIDPPIVH